MDGIEVMGAVVNLRDLGPLIGGLIHTFRKGRLPGIGLAACIAAQEKMASELKIARDIQMSMVPKIFPPFPEHTEFDLYAALAPALHPYLRSFRPGRRLLPLSINSPVGSAFADGCGADAGGALTPA